MRNNLLDLLASKKTVFTIHDAKKLSGMNNDVLRVLLHRLEKSGWIERIEKGKYMIVPLGERKGEYTLNEFVIGSVLIEPYAISYWSALNYHGLTEQIPHTIFLQTTSRKKNREMNVFGLNYKIIKVKESKFFGIDGIWLDDLQIKITDPEKTVVDCLDLQQYSGGLVEVAKAIKNGNLNSEKLSDYALKMNNSGVVRRLGYLCDMFEFDIELSYVKQRNYLYLDSIMEKSGSKNSKWNLIVNVDLRNLE
jgi:predicted transcriptional regulator of viral defense system